MEYTYVPNSYDFKLMEEKGIRNSDFLALQLKYRESFEKWIKKYVDFSKIDEVIRGLRVPVPILESQNDFYHKFSTLESNYLFLRNNFHIERLSEDQIKVILNAILDNELLSIEFLKQTFSLVMYEEGDFVFYGVPMDKTKAPSQSIVMTFAYDMRACSIEDDKLIRQFYPKLFAVIQKTLQNRIDSSFTFLVEDGFTKIEDDIVARSEEREVK